MADGPSQPVQKRQKQNGTDNAQCYIKLPPPQLKVHFHASVTHIEGRLRIWRPQLTSLGIEICKDLTPDVTHVVVNGEANPRNLHALGTTTDAAVVDEAWIHQCMRLKAVAPTKGYTVALPAPSTRDAPPAAGSVPPASGIHAKYSKWLGRWDANLARATHVGEVVLHADYSSQHSTEAGNEPLVALLAELSKYERALSPDSTHPDDLSHEALRYAEVAAVVRACSFPLTPSTTRSHLEANLPFCGSFMAEVAWQLLTTGTCPQLEAFRADQPVTDSRGMVRPGTAGGHTRQLLRRVPGIGAVAALKLYEAGVRGYEQLEAAVAADDPLLGGVGLSKEARWCVGHREDLLQDIPPEEVLEMKQVVGEALQAVAGPQEWNVIEVGGARRGRAGHDVDLLVSPRADREAGGVVLELLEHLVGQGRMVDRGEGFCKVQAGKCPETLGGIRDALFAPRPPGGHRHIADRYDHIWGVYITRGGRYRRLDIMLVPPSQLPFAMLGWTGSRQWLRWLRKHASDRGLALTSHCLARQTPEGWKLVPQEVAALDRDGRTEYLPAGWKVGRALRGEAEVLRLLQLPFKAPAARNCP